MPPDDGETDVNAQILAEFRRFFRFGKLCLGAGALVSIAVMLSRVL
ncbi:hypothetical protein ND748_01265 [Frankia sp. AiPs1]|nr:hypothetical protein [Frankia sp. AiPs1]MCM3920319.1 hypothetical protein [Frankia sp. AiPs1]